jgi:MFS family permease
VKEHLLQDICKPALRIHLLVISFGTGLLDAGSYADFGIFASNQTGNTIILLTEAVASTRSSVGSGAPILTVGVSLAAFLITGAIFGQLGNHFGRCRRIWLAISTLVQASFLLVTAILLQTRVFMVGEKVQEGEYSRRDVDGALVIFMLAAASGIQVSMAKSVG